MYNGDDIIGFTYNNQNYYYIKNAQNDIIGILDNTYNKVVEYSYDSWGNILSITGNTEIANINPFRYRSYYYDKETNLYYLNSRYYNPVWGRFINADGAYDTNQGVLGYNMYLYCLNNTINRIDLFGKRSWSYKPFQWKLPVRDSSWKVCVKKIPNVLTCLPFTKIIGTYGNNKGIVYVTKDDNWSNKYLKFKNPTDVIVFDKRQEADPNIQIKESYKISSWTEKKEITNIIFEYNENNPVSPEWKRTKASFLNEWFLHNIAHDIGFKVERSADCDFNNSDEKLWDLLANVLGK